MQKQRYKVLINWSGEILEFFTFTTSADQALRNAIKRCARKVGYREEYVKKYVKDPNARRWEVR